MNQKPFPPSVILSAKPAARQLQTERLVLRQWRDTDLAPFADMNADPAVMRYFARCLMREESVAMARRQSAAIARRGWGLWAVETRSRREFIGFVGLSVPKAPLPFQPCVEVGWRLAAAHWGQGYASEAARAALRFGFEQLHLDQIVSFTTLANERSRRVMERLGMRADAAHFAHPGLPSGHQYQMHCLYRLRRAQWLEAPPDQGGELPPRASAWP